MTNSLDMEFSTEEVGRMIRVSYRQLQWWDERHVVRPLLVGHRRIYTAQDALECFIVAELRRKGLPLQRVRRSLRGLARVVKGDIAEMMAGRSDLYLLIDDHGRRFNFTSNRDRVLEMAIEAERPILVVSLQPMVRKMYAAKLRHGVAA